MRNYKLFAKLSLALQNRKKPLLFLFILGVIIGVVVLSKNFAQPDSGKIAVKSAKASVNLAREMQFPIKDDQGRELARIKYTLDTAQLRDEIIVQGKKATLVSGKTFLVLTIKIANDYDKAIEINVRDFVRLSVGGNDNEWIAADIHNDPVNVRAQSTKITRIAFTINDSDKNLRLRVGEISGEKQTFDLNIK